MKVLIFISFYFFSVYVFSQDYLALISEAENEYAGKSYSRSVEKYKNAFRLQQGTESDYYNAACSAALNNQPTLSLKWLNIAVSKGYINFRHMRNDADLISLHNSKEWKTLIRVLERKVKIIEAGYDKNLQERLLIIYDEDQKYRARIVELNEKRGYDSLEIKELWKIVSEKDSINLIQVKSILDHYGWVGADQVGQKANSALFLVIQHADLPTQLKYLPLLRKAVKAKKAQPSALALLEDRVALGEGKNQIYGTQIGGDNTDKPYVLPLDDPDNVDRRRKAVGLSTMSSYVKRWGIKWDVELYKKALLEAKTGDGK